MDFLVKLFGITSITKVKYMPLPIKNRVIYYLNLDTYVQCRV